MRSQFGLVQLALAGGDIYTADALFDLLSLTPLLSTMIVVNVDTAEVSAPLAPVLRSLQRMNAKK